ncbi:glycosyltransferase family 4 protein [Chloroflexia bacterium SDU3-3]|nr:glycosyltransferase family 4 protein [Chloroflexia bacterium SDU3-3]
MRILVALDYYYPHWTGLTAYAKRIAEGLAQRGHSVTVLASQHESYLPIQETINNVRVVRVPIAGRFSRGVIMPLFPIIAAQLVRETDVIHIHTPMPETIILTALGRLFSKPSLVTHQGDVVMPKGFKNQIIQQGVRVLSLGLHVSNYVVVHNADYGRHSTFLQQFKHKLGAIYPPVILPEPDLEAIVQKKRDLGIEDKKIIGFAGRFVEEKGFDILLQAMPLVKQAVPDVHFVFAGEINVVYEKFYESCHPMIEANKDILTPLGLLHSPQDLANFYAMCDIFALPSRTDCFPSVQIEAMVCGTPSVTTDIPGAREAVQVTGMGKLVPPLDPQALAEGLIHMVSDPTVYKTRWEKARQVFDPAASIEAYEHILQQLDQRVPIMPLAEVESAH